MAREYTCALLELMDEGVISPEKLAEDLAGWMSEDEVAEFYKKNGYNEIRDLEKELGY